MKTRTPVPMVFPPSPPLRHHNITLPRQHPVSTPPCRHDTELPCHRTSVPSPCPHDTFMLHGNGKCVRCHVYIPSTDNRPCCGDLPAGSTRQPTPAIAHFVHRVGTACTYVAEGWVQTGSATRGYQIRGTRCTTRCGGCNSVHPTSTL